MHITQLHELARRELTSLAQARYMPHGYSRQASRTADLKHRELSKYLDEALARQPDRLMQRPEHLKLKSLHTTAAGERTLRAMVFKMVELMASLPVMDQGDAHALAEIATMLNAAERLRSQLQKTREDFENLEDHAQRLELSYADIYKVLADLERQVALKTDALQDNERALTETV